MKLFTPLIAVALSFSTLHADDKEKAQDPIDAAMAADIDKNPSTAGMMDAGVKAMNSWKKDIAESLNKLKKTMTPEEVEALEVSQKAWEVYAATETSTLSELYGKMEGTMWRPASVMNQMQLYKDRALRLRGYLETLSER